MAFKLDPQLERFANPRQWETLKAWDHYGSQRKAASATGIREEEFSKVRARVYRKAAQAGYAPENDLTKPLPRGLILSGTSLRYDADGNVDQYWNKSRLEGRDPEEVVKIPDSRIDKVATLYDHQGQVTQQWVSEKPSPEDRARKVIEEAEAWAAKLPRVPAVKAPQGVHEHLLAAYPVGDHHIGMLAWKAETEDNYDLEIAEGLLTSAVKHLVKTVPRCSEAIVVFLGDFMHYDGWVPVTPTSKNPLDADGRFPKMVEVALRTMRTVVEIALAHHEKVRVIVDIGNHDLASAIWLQHGLSAIYEKNKRLTVDKSPRHFHYHVFGRNLIGTHHGHGVKMDRLPNIMAADQAEAWGQTDHRVWWTGHIHHEQKRDYEGCSVESFRVLPPADAWANQKGYRPMRGMKAIVLHKEYGEVARHTVTPEMLE